MPLNKETNYGQVSSTSITIPVTSVLELWDNTKITFYERVMQAFEHCCQKCIEKWCYATENFIQQYYSAPYICCNFHKNK